MEKIISTYIEEPQENLFFVDEKPNKNNLKLAPVSLVPVYKTVRMFDAAGTMYLRHYDEDEWRNLRDVTFDRYHSLDTYCDKRRIGFNLLLRYFNWCLEDVCIEDVIKEIKQEDLDIKYSTLNDHSKEFIDEIEAWIKSGQKKPFESEKARCSCRKLMNNDDIDGADAWYEIDYFGVKKEDK